MRQVLRIFKKDARYLWYEIAVILLLSALMPFADRIDWGPGFLDAILLFAAWLNLTVRVIHSEALPGTTQFWLTRPYSRVSLLAAKVLFLTAFIILPMAISDAFTVALTGFSPMLYLPGLLWEMPLRSIAYLAPIVVLAALVRNLTGFITAALLAVLVTPAVIFISLSSSSDWGVLNWLRYSFIAAFVALGAASLLIWQYTRRATLPGRIVAAVLLVLGAASAGIPSSVGWSIAHALSHRWNPNGNLTVTLDPSVPRKPFPRAQDPILVEIPLRVTGVPEGLIARADDIRVELIPESVVHSSRGAAGSTFDGLRNGGGAWPPTWDADSSGVHYQIRMSDDFNQIRREPQRLIASLVLTLTRPLAPPKTLAQIAGKVMIPGAGRCDARFATCELPFRPPSNLFLSDARKVSWTSYSPFPAEAAIDPMNVVSMSNSPLTISTEEPVEHVRQIVVLDDLRLDDLFTPER